MPFACARERKAETHCAKGKRADWANMSPQAPEAKTPNAAESTVRRENVIVIARSYTKNRSKIVVVPCAFERGIAFAARGEKRTSARPLFLQLNLLCAYILGSASRE